jgi:hypothetical protein
MPILGASLVLLLPFTESGPPRFDRPVQATWSTLANHPIQNGPTQGKSLAAKPIAGQAAGGAGSWTWLEVGRGRVNGLACFGNHRTYIHNAPDETPVVADTQALRAQRS